MRLAEGTAAPALPMMIFWILPLMPLSSSGRGGALVSATSTSPPGSVYSQRGCERPEAKAATVSPLAGTGASPAFQPMASAILTVGTSIVLGAGNTGLAPCPAATCKLAVSPQAASSSGSGRIDKRRMGYSFTGKTLA